MLLRRLRFVARRAATTAVVRRAEVRVLDHMIGGMVVELEAHVLGRERGAEQWEIVEAPAYASWRDHLIDSLPAGSIRRRWLVAFAGHDARVTRVRHLVTARAFDAFPDCAAEYPPPLGAPVRVVTWDALSDEAGR